MCIYSFIAEDQKMESIEKSGPGEDEAGRWSAIPPSLFEIDVLIYLA